MDKQIIKITESDLHRIVKESVKRIIDEAYDDFATNHNSLKKYSSDGIIRKQCSR